MTKPSPDPLFVLRGSEGAINTLSFHQDQQNSRDWLVSGCSCGKVNLWDLDSRRIGSTLDGHHGQGVIWSQWLEATNTLLSHGRDGRIQKWEFCEDGWRRGGSIQIDSCSFCKASVVQQGNGHYLAFPNGTSNEIVVYDLETEKRVQSLIPQEGNTAYGMVMAIHSFVGPNDKLYVLSGYEDGSIAVWDLQEHRLLSRLKAAHREPVICLDYSLALSKGISGSADNQVSSWSFHHQTELRIENQQEITNSGISDVKIRNDDKIVATAGWDSRIRLFSWKSLKALAVLAYHGESVHALAFGSRINSSQPSASLLAAGSKDKHISFWSLYN